MKRIGFGQVEPNHLSAQRTGQIYAQLKAHIYDASVENSKPTIPLLENGQFVKYDYLNNEINFDGNGEWMLVFNEVKLYDDKWRESYKDFALIRKNFTDSGKVDAQGKPIGDLVPRVFKTNIGDIFTTNCLTSANTSGTAEVNMGTIALGDKLGPNSSTGYLTVIASSAQAQAAMLWEVVKVYKLADGQDAVKIMRIK